MEAHEFDYEQPEGDESDRDTEGHVPAHHNRYGVDDHWEAGEQSDPSFCSELSFGLGQHGGSNL